MKSLAKYPATVAGVKRGLRQLRRSQNQAAAAVGKSPGLVSQVLGPSHMTKSQPLLDALAAWLNDGAPLVVKAS